MIPAGTSFSLCRFSSWRYNIYDYVLTAIIASHSPQVWNLLLRVAQDEQEPEKMQLLLSALALVQHDRAIEKLMRELQQKISLA